MNKIFTSKKSLLIFTLIYSTTLFYLLFFAFFRTNTNTTVNWVPFKNIIELTRYTLATGHGILHWLINIPGNILVFVPIAVPLKYFNIQIKSWIHLVLLFLLPVFLEFLQYIFQSGSADIDDVILNVTGIFLGLYLFRRFA